MSHVGGIPRGSPPRSSGWVARISWFSQEAWLALRCGAVHGAELRCVAGRRDCVERYHGTAHQNRLAPDAVSEPVPYLDIEVAAMLSTAWRPIGRLSQDHGNVLRRELIRQRVSEHLRNL